jgi:hypothetical protein
MSPRVFLKCFECQDQQRKGRGGSRSQRDKREKGTTGRAPTGYTRADKTKPRIYRCKQRFKSSHHVFPLAVKCATASCASVMIQQAACHTVS